MHARPLLASATAAIGLLLVGCDATARSAPAATPASAPAAKPAAPASPTVATAVVNAPAPAAPAPAAEPAKPWSPPPALDIPEENDDARPVCAQALKRVEDRLAMLRAAAPDPLYAKHTDAIRALVRYEHAQAQKPEGDPRAQIRYCNELLEHLAADAATAWKAITARSEPMLVAWTAADGSWQAAKLWLPAEWKRAQAYPALVYLHGKLGPEPLRWLTRAVLDSSTVDVRDAGGLSPVVVEPWGHGNEGYAGAGKQDASDSLTAAATVVKLDAKRAYLCGHGIGATGVAHILLAEPARWTAAVACNANLAELPAAAGAVNAGPVRVLHGDTAEAPEVVARLKALGLRCELDSEDFGKGFPDDRRSAAFAWLLQQRRQ